MWDEQLALDDLVAQLEGSGKAVFIAGVCRQSDTVRRVVESAKAVAR